MNKRILCLFACLLIGVSNYAYSGTKWANNGAVVCTAVSDRDTPVTVSDGAGGAIIAWQDLRNGGEYTLYSQRIDANGVSKWAATGVTICTPVSGGSTIKLSLSIVSDGAGGAIIVWQSTRNPSIDIYAQRVDANGNIPAGWVANGNQICTQGSDQRTPRAVSDGSGGAIIAWVDPRSGDNNIYAQRVNSAGTVQWTVDGLAICTATSWQYGLAMVTDGVGGAIIAWGDQRISNSNYDIYAQRID
ncbi:MAG: hypothetical protein WCK36_02980, partial [Candidatus Firestonebacteria bacterium]